MLPPVRGYRQAQWNDWIIVDDYSMYTQRYPTVYIEDLSPSQMGALKNVADFVMLKTGNNLDIFATALNIGEGNHATTIKEPNHIGTNHIELAMRKIRCAHHPKNQC